MPVSNPLELIDLIADEFERQWQPNRVPDFESFVKRIASAYRESLTAEIVRIDFALLRKNGVPHVDPDRYLNLGGRAMELASKLVDDPQGYC